MPVFAARITGDPHGFDPATAGGRLLVERACNRPAVPRLSDLNRIRLTGMEDNVIIILDGLTWRGGIIINRWKDWYAQGKRDLERASLDLTHEFYEWACFTAQQSAEKVLKGLALNLGITIWGHSLTEILVILEDSIAVEEEIKEMGKVLDLYYIPARYPNGFPSGKPADYFTEKQAEEAINAAGHIARFCESLLFG